MKGAVKKVHRLRRAIAWLLTAAIVAGNISQLSITTAYASELAESRSESTSNVGKASPSEASPSEAARIIDVQVTQSSIEKVLKKDFNRRPELNEDLVPFEGDQKDLVIGKLYEELEGKTLVLQKKVGKAMYLVVVSDTLDGEPYFESHKSERIKQDSILKNIQVIGVNGYKDRDCEFRLRIVGDDLMITDAQMEEFAVIGENSQEEKAAQPSSAGTRSGNPVNSGSISGSGDTGSSGSQETTDVTEEETNDRETEIQETEVQETEAQGTEAQGTGEADKNLSEPDEETQDQAGEVTEAQKEENSREAVEEPKDTENDTAKEAAKEDAKEAVKEEAGKENQDHAGQEEKSGDSDSEKSGAALSVSSIGINGISVTRHKVPVLFSSEGSLATASEAEIDDSLGEEADLVFVGDTKVLSEDERAALMGTDVAALNGEEKKTSLFSFLSKPSFGMVVRSYGITLLNTEISGEGKLSPYETALTYYGPDATDEKETVEVSLSQSQTGSIKAGVLYTYTITYTMQAAPLYEYAAGGKLSLFDAYENAKIRFTVPAGIIIEEQPGKVELISSDDDGKVYEISVGDEQNVIRPGKSDSITMNAYIDGNGKRAVGEQFNLSENSVAFYADVKVADKTDTEHVEYPGNIETVTYANQPGETTLTLVSDDVWHIKKSLNSTGDPYTVVRDGERNPEFVDITYLIEVGMYGSSNTISRQPDGVVYQTYGRTGFQEGSFKITDSLKIVTENAPEAMMPVSVTAKWGNGSDIPVILNGDGSITIEKFKTKGQNEADHIYVSDQAPTYSSYLVTARYPYEPFLLKYNDERIGNSDVFTVNNKAHLEYVKLGTDQLMTEDSGVNVAIHEFNEPAVIKIKKEIDEGLGLTQKYGLDMEKEYPGLAGFEIYSVDADNNQIPYDNYTVIDSEGQKINNRNIVVNPSNDETESGFYATEDDGYIQIQVDPGTYVIKEKETEKPVGTQFNSAKVGTKPVANGEDIKVTLKAGENAEVTVVNEVIGKGAIEFYKKARTWDSVTASETDLNVLKEAEFTLYQKNEGGSLTEVKTVKSDSNGYVLFKPLTPGQYVVREKSAKGYIIDNHDYEVTVYADVTSPVKDGDNNFLVNTLNQAKVRVTKLMQDDNGDYINVLKAYRGDFNDKFWIEKKVAGTWEKVSIDSKITYSLDDLEEKSQFTVTLPVYDGSHEIEYRVVEEVPEGYSDGNGNEAGFSQEEEENKTYIYKNFSLKPLETSEVTLKNNKGGTLKLQKEAWSVDTEDGTLDKNASKSGFQFKLYYKNKGNFTEVLPATTYTTDSKGEILVKGLDVTKQYYWSEINGTGRLEAENFTKAETSGDQIFIGPYAVSRKSDTIVKAYNIPQKVPYWFYKVDITNEDNSISARFKITVKDSDSEEVAFDDWVSTEGTYITLDPGTTYIIEETVAPDNFVKGEKTELITPDGPVKKTDLERWFAKDNTENHKTFKNEPYKLVTIKKTQYDADGNKDSGIGTIIFEICVVDGSGFKETGTLNSNTQTPLAPGTYYFKEKVPDDNINPYNLLSNEDKTEGDHPGYKIFEKNIYYGPVVITAASAGSKEQDICLAGTDKPLVNYKDNGKVMVTKKDALRGTPVNGAVFGIFKAAGFDVNNWEASISNPIETVITDGKDQSAGQAIFSSTNLKVFDKDGKRISYVIAEITPPAGYLPSHEILTTVLQEGKVIDTVNGVINGSPLVIKNEPKLTIRTQKYWIDEWNNQFYPADHVHGNVLGNVKLALYKVNAEDIAKADYVETVTTNEYDGMATFYNINRNDTYFVVEVRVPTKEETGFDFDLTMGNKIPLANGDEEPPKTLTVSELRNGKYNAVEYTGKDLPEDVDSLIQKTNNLLNYKPWVQFNILKTCDGKSINGDSHQPENINGAKFTLYKMKMDKKDLSGIKLEDLADENRFEMAGSYESGTRVDPQTGERVSGEFDTTILETGKVYWLVEDEPAPGYLLPGGRQIVAVFVPKDSGYTGYDEMLHGYGNGRNEQITVVKNQHGTGPGGLDAYYFQIKLNKWLKNPAEPDAEPTLLGGAKFQIWLLDPDSKANLLPIEVVETGLESDENNKTGYALSKMINIGKLKEALADKRPEVDADRIFKVENNNVVKALFGLEEVYAPSKVQMDPTLHYLEAEIPKSENFIDSQYFWKEGNDPEYRLMNTVLEQYPVTIAKYGYVPDSSTFGKTDEKLDALNIPKTPLSGVKFELWQYLWKEENGTGRYEYKKIEGLYTTDSNGQVKIPKGLQAGRYRLKETMTDAQKQKYITMYTGGERGPWRYFTVGSNSSNVNVYNPEKPDLVVEKTTWAGDSSVNLEGITFTIQKSGGSELQETTKPENGKYTATFKNLDSGTYIVKAEALGSGAAGLVTDRYFKETTVNVGYVAKVDNEKTSLNLIEGATGKRETATIKNPRLADLVIHKIDAEKQETDSNMAGASFKVKYLKFRSDTDLIGGSLKDVKDKDYVKPDQEFDTVTVTRTLTDNKDGTYTLKDCEPGWYRITEEKAPAGYTIDTQPIIVPVVADMADGYEDNFIVSFKNRQKVGLTVTKKLFFGDGFKNDENIADELPAEIVFDIYTNSNNTYKNVLDETGNPVQVIIQGFKAQDGYYTASGTALLPQKPEGGAYYLKEQENSDWMLSALGAVENGTLQANGYIKVGGEDDFNSKSPVSITVNNEYAKARILLTKVDRADHSKKLTGAAFKLYSDQQLTKEVGNFTEIGQSGVYEIVFSTKVHSPGTYYIKEVNAPAGYIAVTTAIPVEGLAAETGKTTEITVQNQGGIDLQITKYSGNGGSESLKSGITFELYRRIPGGIWNYVAEGTTDSQGKLSFRGLELPAGDTYGVYEVTKYENGFETFRMDSLNGAEGTILPTTTDVTKNGETKTGLDLYILTGSNTVTPGVYSFEAHNQEALPLRLIKNDVNKPDNPGSSIAVSMKVMDEETGTQVGNTVTVPYGETGATVQLLPGTYIIEETAVTQNSQGYIINKDDARTVYRKEVKVKKGVIPDPCEFTNVKQKAGVTLDKTSLTTTLKDLWWNEGQTVTYTLTPNVANSIPLDRFVVTDTGLKMLDAGKSVILEDEYTYEKYTIVSIKPGKATEQNHIQGAKTGSIMADVTFYDFNENQVGAVQSVTVSGDGEIGLVKPVTGKKVKSFQISYRDDTLKASTENHYVLGNDFVPGSIEVTVKLNRQDAKLSNGTYKKEIKYIRNEAEVAMDFRKWDINGTLVQSQEKSQAKKDCDIQVVQSQAPIISVKKSVDPIKGIQPSDILTYTLYVKNDTTSNDPDIVPLQKPILIDYVPLGVTVSGESVGENRLLKAVTLKDAPQSVAIEKTVKKVDQTTGRETLFIQLSGGLDKGESVTVEVKAQIAGSIINYGKNILNELYVTSDVLQPAFSLNQTGASFMIKTDSGSKWPSADLPKDVQLPDEKYLNYGYASDSAENTMRTGTGLVLYKEVKGNLDTRFVSGTTVGKVAKSAEDTDLTDSDGSVLYRLTVNNASANDFITRLQLMDILPVKGDYSTGNFERLSDYRLKYVGIESIAIENRKDNGADGRKVSDFSYDVTYSDKIFKDTATAKAGKDSMLSDNSDGFWFGSSSEPTVIDPTAIRIKITDPDFYLAPGENLVVAYKTVVPYTDKKDLDDVAYGYAVNDFATSYSSKKSLEDTSETKFPLAQTSNAVQVLLVPGNVKVSGRIWIDDNNNAIQDESIINDHLLTDLLPVLQSKYFNVSLLKYGKSGDDPVSGVVDVSDARFLFDGLTPAKPFGITGSEFTQEQENSWYSNQSLIVSKLKGEDPAHYRIYVTTGTMPAGYEDLVLKLTKPTMLSTGQNAEAGRSRFPDTLAEGGKNYEESLDSNFKETNDSYASEDFFLWSAGDDYDKTKDIGFVPFRNVTIKKTNEAGNPVEGAHFSVYGPYTNEEMEGFRQNGIKNAADLGSPVAQGNTVLDNNEAVWSAGELLYYRNYIVVEDGAPAGYEIANAQTDDMVPMTSYQVNGHKAWELLSKEFKTSGNPVPSTITVKNSYVSGSLEFTKLDGLTGKELGGAAFKIEKKGAVLEDAWKAFTEAMKADPGSMGVTKVTETSNGIEFEVVSGKVTLTGIPYGTYTLSEIRVPDGYDITKKQADIDFQIETDGQKAVLSGLEDNLIKNTRTDYSLSLKKADNAGNDKVAGISFAITGPGKYESSSWIPFAKADFKLNDPSESGYEVKQTDGEGLIKWNLPYGDYKIEELDAAGYEPVEPFYVRIDVNGKVSLLNGEGRGELILDSEEQNQINLIIKNVIKTGSLSVEKIDGETGKAIAGAQFELSGTSVINGAFEAYQNYVLGLGVSGVSTGNENGRLWIRFQVDGTGDSKTGLLTQIPYGTYTLTEIKAPDGYLFNSGSQWTKAFTIESAEGVKLTGGNGIVNTPHELNIEKRDQKTEEVLSGAVFMLMTADGKYVALDGNNSYTGLKESQVQGSAFTTGSDGRVTVKRLPAGNYILKETQAPANYGVTADTEITVLRSGNSETVVVYDLRNKAKIRINKAASHNHEMRLDGAVFEIYSDKDLTALEGTMTTENGGIGESEMLPLGTYYVKEQKAPAGYELSDRVYEVTLLSDKEAYTVLADGNDFVIDDYGTGSLVFDKVDSSTGEKIASAQFSLNRKDTNVDGAYERFLEDIGNKSQAELEAMGIMDVETEGGKIRFTAVNGHMDIKEIPYGTYILKEEKAPKGYLSLNGKAEFEFTITEDQREADLGNGNEVVNERAQFELQLKKADNLGNSISGIQFEILGPGRYEENGVLSIFGANRFKTDGDSDTGLFTTGADGLIHLGLKHGDYQIREASSDRYDSIDPFYIRIDGEGKVSILKDNSKAAVVSNDALVTVTVTNKISTGNLEMEKVDGENTGKRLEGAEFVLSNLSTLVPGAWDSYRNQAAADGAAWTADQVVGNTITFVLNGKGVITNLPYGTYRLTEIMSPDGYLLGTAPWTAEFTINEANKEIRYTTPGLFEKTNGAIANMPSKITVVKTNAVYADVKLKGAEFILKASDGKYVKLDSGSFAGYTDDRAAAGIFVTGNDGQFVIKRLPKDTYTFIETKAPTGYYINSNIPPVTLDGVNSFTITIQDERIRGGGGSSGGPSGRDNPGGPGAAVTIVPDPVPLANLPGDGSIDLLNVDDGNVPLANLPKTGDRQKAAGKVMVALSGFMMALYAALSKKKKEN